MKVTSLFPDYLFEYDYPDHDKHKDACIQRIRSLNDYYEPHKQRDLISGKLNSLITSHPDIYKDELFFPIKEYMTVSTKLYHI